MCTTKVLVVDDDIVMSQILTACLQDYGFEVRSANSGKEALAVFAEETFQVVVTDLIMDEIDGHEVTRQVKKSAPETHVVVITGACEKQEKPKAYKNGADGFLSKPFDMTKLLEKITPMPKKTPGRIECDCCEPSVN